MATMSVSVSLVGKRDRSVADSTSVSLGKSVSLGSWSASLGSWAVCVSVSTIARLIESGVRGENEVWLFLGREDRLGRLGHLRLLALGKADDTACNPVAHTFAVAALTVMGLFVLGLVEIILSLVEDH